MNKIRYYNNIKVFYNKIIYLQIVRKIISQSILTNNKIQINIKKMNINYKKQLMIQKYKIDIRNNRMIFYC